MIQVDNHQPVHNTPGLGHCESSDSNSSSTSPPAITHASRPNYAPGDTQHNSLIHWNQTPTNYDKPTEKSDDENEDDDEYRPFTPPPPRERLSYTRYQIELLSGIYEKVRYPNSTQKQLIAKRVGITREQVKIWFQNRRRKDVINNPKQKDKTVPSKDGSSISTESESGTSPDTSDQKQQTPSVCDLDGPKMVPDVVLKSVISELERFEKTVLKAKKSKKKSRQKQQQQQQQQQQRQLQQKITNASIKTNAVSLFNAYDMISPPNKVISQAFLDTSVNRFSHSKSTSAFQDPKSNGEVANSMLPLQLGYQQAPNIITVLPNEHSHHHSNGMAPLMNPQSKVHSMFENIPVLADLLGYRTNDPPRSQKQHLGHPINPHNLYASPRCNPERVYGDIPASVNHGTLGVNRVFPFPFIADAPAMLSSVRHPDPYRPPVHYLPPQHTDDPYQPFMISSFTNPYYTATGAPTQTWVPQQTVTNDNNYTAGTVL